MSKRLLLVVFALALVLRLGFTLELRHDELARVLLGDAVRFDAWAREIAAGNWLGSEVFYQAPLYPYFMALVYGLFDADVLALRLVQAVLGAASCVLVAAASARLFHERAGLWAGVFLAFYAPAIWLEGLVQKTSLALFLSSLLVFVVARHAHGRRLRTAACLGCVLGLLILVRENAAVLLLPLGVWLLRSSSTADGAPPRTRTLLAFTGALALVLVPVGLRNASLGGAFLPTASNAGVNFYIGNSANSDGLYTPLVRGHGHPDHEQRDAQRIATEPGGQELSPAAVSAHWFGRGLEDVRADPGRWLGLLLTKAKLVLNRVEVMDAEALESYRDRSLVLGLLAPVTTFGLLLPLAVLGFLRARRREVQGHPLMACALFLGLSIVLFFVVARFRIGLASFLAPFVGLGLAELLERLRTPRRLLELGPALVLAGLALLVAHLPVDLPGDPRSTTASNLASAYLRRGEPQLAFDRANEAVGFDPANAEAHFNRGLAAKELGNYPQAEADLQLAMRLAPAYAADGAAELGAVRALQGDFTGALAFCESAVRADPTHGLAHYYRGLVLRNLNRLEEAGDAYAEAIRHRPDLVDAHHNLGYLRELQGRWAEADRAYRAALELDPGFELSREARARLLREHPELATP